jgi:predicted nucleotidyltransferase
MYDKKIVTELKASLVDKFSENINKVILFGSRVEGNADEYSDYDILIILRNDYDWRYKLIMTGDINIKSRTCAGKSIINTTC